MTDTALGPDTLPPLAAARAVFRDHQQDAAYRALGYVVIDGVPEDLLEALDRAVAAALPDGVDGFHSTLQSTDTEYRHGVATTIPPIVEPLAAEILEDYAPFAASLTVKGIGDGSQLPSHQDWTMVDEDQFRGMNIWIPLVDTTVENGALRVLPRSHRALDHLRCSPCSPGGFESFENDVPIDQLIDVPLRRGQALVFDQGLLHGSGPNHTDRWRPAVTVAYAPAEAPLLHHHVPDPAADSIDVYAADPEFFVTLTIGSKPDRDPVSSRKMAGRSWAADDLVAACLPHVSTASTAGPRTFVDDELQAAFDRDGYVVVDLLTPSQVVEMQAIVDGVFEGGPEGFHATNMLPSTTYRRAVWEVLRPALEPLAAPLLDDYEACTAALMIKFPDEASGFVTHQDWSLVDEERFRSLNVWCPLVDTGEENGGLRVLPGSHRALGAVRPSPAPPATYLHPGWTIDPAALDLLEVAAGQAVFFDHAILHGSEPNRGSEPRPAITLAMKPRGADLLHWFVPDAGEDIVERYAIDPDYLADFVLGEPPPYPLVATEPFRRDQVSADELLGAPTAAAAAETPEIAEVPEAPDPDPAVEAPSASEPEAPLDLAAAPAPAAAVAPEHAAPADRPPRRLIDRWRSFRTRSAR